MLHEELSKAGGGALIGLGSLGYWVTVPPIVYNFVLLAIAVLMVGALVTAPFKIKV